MLSSQRAVAQCARMVAGRTAVRSFQTTAVVMRDFNISDLPLCAQASPYPVDCKPGDKVPWCTCGLSNKQPRCDGSHRGTPFKPLRYQAPEDVGEDPVYFCGCKQTKNPPFCDGSHNDL